MIQECIHDQFYITIIRFCTYLVEVETQLLIVDVVHGNRVLVREGDPTHLNTASHSECPTGSLDPHMLHLERVSCYLHGFFAVRLS